jgi:hypothetical protein
MGSFNSPHGSGYGYAAAPAPARRVDLFAEDSSESKRSGYGLPCARCKTYYPANLAVCPVCRSSERVSPIEPLASINPAEQLPDPEQLEQERERFLAEFNAQVVHAPVAEEAPLAGPGCCGRQETHLGSPEPPTVCQSCYDQLEERVDVLEAALHMDLHEAAQIVYDAVWADPSDPTKTYQNAAHALLVELRRRSAIPQVFGQLPSPIN